MSGPVPAISGDLRATLRRLKLGQVLDTLPERLVLASAHGLAHAEFLELVLSDEVSRRDVVMFLQVTDHLVCWSFGLELASEGEALSPDVRGQSAKVRET